MIGLSAIKTSAVAKRNYIRNIILLQEQERRSVSWIMREDIGNILVGLYLQISELKNEVCRHSVNSDIPKTFAKLSFMSNTLRESIDKVKVFSRHFRPAGLDAAGLKGGILELLEEFRCETTITWDITCEGFDIIQEPYRSVVFRLFEKISTKVKNIEGVENVYISCKSERGRFFMDIKIAGRNLTKEDNFRYSITRDPHIYEYCKAFDCYIGIDKNTEGINITIAVPSV